MDLSLLPLVFSHTLTVASRLLHLYSTNDKNTSSRLKMKSFKKKEKKSFSTVKDTQKGSKLHRGEKRKEGDRGDQEEKRGSQKVREEVSQ